MQPSQFYRIKEFRVGPVKEYSDHCPLQLRLDFGQPAPEVEDYEMVKEDRLVWREEVKDEVVQLLSDRKDEMLEIVNQEEDVNTKAERLSEMIKETVFPVIGKKGGIVKERKYKFPSYASDYFKKLKKYMDDARKLADVTSGNQASREYKRLRNLFIKQKKKEKRKHDEEETERLMGLENSDMRGLWKDLRGEGGKKKPLIKLPQMTTYFKSIMCPDNDSFYRPTEQVIRTLESGDADVILYPELDREISRDELGKVVKNLKNNKSGGHDKIVNELLKSSDDLVDVVLPLYNEVLRTGVFPKTWSKGVIVPLLKKGFPHEVTNYRGITLLPILGKVLSKVLTDRMLKWANENDKISLCHAGFRPGFTTTDNAFILSGFIEKWMKMNKRLYFTMVDFQKAFDTVNFDVLWCKLIRKGVRGQILKVFRSMYESIQSEVRGFCGRRGEAFGCMMGIRQGESASPVLFSFLIDDIVQAMEGCEPACGAKWDTLALHLLMYADDVCILADTTEGMQAALNELERYCEEWGLTVNINKTKVLTIRKEVNIRHPQFSYKGAELENVNYFTYLGITIAFNGNPDSCAKAIALKAKKAMFGLEKLLYRYYFPIGYRIRFFKTLIEPILLYGSEYWGISTDDVTDVTFNRYLKNLLKLRSSTSTAMLMLETGEIQMEAKKHMRVLVYWGRILNEPEQKLTRIVYEMMVRENEREEEIVKFRWPKRVEEILRMYGLHVWWIRQSTPEGRNWKEYVKDKVTRWWRSQNENSLHERRGELYKDLYERGMAGYLNTVGVGPARTLARLRLRNIFLKCETGLWRQHKLPVERCLCSECQVYEDEVHVIFHCTKFAELKRKYLPDRLKLNATRSGLIRILRSNDRQDLTCLACFITRMKTKMKDFYTAEVLPLTVLRRDMITVENNMTEEDISIDLNDSLVRSDEVYSDPKVTSSVSEVIWSD